MTFREKLMLEHPSEIRDGICGGAVGCPASYGYESPKDKCIGINNKKCTECWDREIPSAEKIGGPLSKVTIVSRDVNGKREIYKFDSWDAVDVSDKDESEEILLILIEDICIYSKLAHTWITWEVVRGFFA